FGARIGGKQTMAEWHYSVMLEGAGEGGTSPGFDTQSIAAPPKVPGNKDAAPDEKTGRETLKLAKQLKKVNVLVPAGLSDVVHALLDAKDNNRVMSGLWVMLKTKDEQGVESSRDAVIFDGAKVLRLAPTAGGTYVVYVESSGAQHFVYTPGKGTK